MPKALVLFGMERNWSCNHDATEEASLTHRPGKSIPAFSRYSLRQPLRLNLRSAPRPCLPTPPPASINKTSAATGIPFPLKVHLKTSLALPDAASIFHRPARTETPHVRSFFQQRRIRTNMRRYPDPQRLRQANLDIFQRLDAQTATASALSPSPTAQRRAHRQCNGTSIFNLLLASQRTDARTQSARSCHQRLQAKPAHTARPTLSTSRLSTR